MPDADKPCTCLDAVALHSGHCCARNIPADHQPGQPAPCHEAEWAAQVEREATIRQETTT